MYKPYMKVKKPSRWLIGNKITRMQEIYKFPYVAIREKSDEFTILPSWCAKCFTVRYYKKLVEENRLYSAIKNPYR